MTRSTILTVLFVALAALGFTSTASAPYDPALGRWLARDPAAAPVRIGAPRLADAYRVPAGGGTPVQWQLADGVQTIDEAEEPLPPS